MWLEGLSHVGLFSAIAPAKHLKRPIRPVSRIRETGQQERDFSSDQQFGADMRLIMNQLFW